MNTNILALPAAQAAALVDVAPGSSRPAPSSQAAIRTVLSQRGTAAAFFANPTSCVSIHGRHSKQWQLGGASARRRAARPNGPAAHDVPAGPGSLSTCAPGFPCPAPAATMRFLMQAQPLAFRPGAPGRPDDGRRAGTHPRKLDRRRGLCRAGSGRMPKAPPTRTVTNVERQTPSTTAVVRPASTPSRETRNRSD